MGRHGKELTTEQKEILLSLSHQGFSSYKIQEFTGINCRTIQKFLKRTREKGSIENNPRSGGRKKTTPRDERVLFRSVKRNRRQTLKDLTARFNNRTGCNVSERTVRRRLCFDGYKRRMICKKITISRVNRDRRMGFCRQKLHWNVQNNWSSIIFSDETKFCWVAPKHNRSTAGCLKVVQLAKTVGSKPLVGLPPNIDFPISTQQNFVSSLNIMDDQLF
jgi:transposase